MNLYFLSYANIYMYIAQFMHELIFSNKFLISKFHHINLIKFIWFYCYNYPSVVKLICMYFNDIM